MKKKRSKKDRSGTGHVEDVLASWERARPDLDLREFLQGIALMRIGRILDLSFDRMCRRDHGISGADMRVLFALRRAGAPFELRPTDLFKALLVASGTISKQIDRLIEKSYVERKPDANHGGGFLIKLTRQGRDVADYATNFLATKSLLLKGGAGISQELKEAGEQYVYAVLKELERHTDFGLNLPSR